MPIVLDGDSLRSTLRHLDGVGPHLRQAARGAVRAAGKMLADQVKHNVSALDHSQNQLAEMDHPYARRHGDIKGIHQSRMGGTINDARHLVHRRSGIMARSVRSGFQHTGTGGAIAFDVWFDLSLAPHIRMVLEGTPTMLPRDPIWETAMGPATKTRMRDVLVLELQKQFRGNIPAGFRL